jgi:tetratricopeptide (TPR) repeat protein
MDAIEQESFLSSEWRDRLKASTYILDGTVERTRGARIKVKVNLQKVGIKEKIEFSVKDGKMAVHEALADDILAELEKRLKIRLSSEQIDRKAEARILVGKARMYMGFKEYEKAIECAQGAMVLDHENFGYRNLLAEILDWQLIYIFGYGKDPENFKKTGKRLLLLCRDHHVTFEPFFIANNELSAEMRAWHRLLRSTRLDRAEYSKNRKAYCRELFLMLYYDDKIFDDIKGKINARMDWLKCFREELKKPDSKSIKELSLGSHHLLLSSKDFERISPNEKAAWLGFCQELQKTNDKLASLIGVLGEMRISDQKNRKKLFDENLLDYGFHPMTSKEMAGDQEIKAIFKGAFKLLPDEYTDSLLKSGFDEFMEKPETRFLSNRGWIILEYLDDLLMRNYNKTTDKSERKKISISGLN